MTAVPSLKRTFRPAWKYSVVTKEIVEIVQGAVLAACVVFMPWLVNMGVATPGCSDNRFTSLGVGRIPNFPTRLMRWLRTTMRTDGKLSMPTSANGQHGTKVIEPESSMKIKDDLIWSKTICLKELAQVASYKRAEGGCASQGPAQAPKT